MDEDRLARLEQRLEDLDKRESAMEKAMDRAMDKSRAAMGHLLPSETRRHMRASWHENLLAVRSLLDYWVERTSDKPKTEQPNGGRENIPID
jgi:hypothetical protein